MNKDILAGIKKVVVHDQCPDGLAAALIVRDALPDVALEFMQYNTPRHKAMEPEPGVMFVDFTPWVEREKDPPHAMTADGLARAKAWADAGAVVLDHHEGAQDLVALFGERGVFGKNEDLECGARLAFQHVWWPTLQDEKRFIPDHHAVERFVYVAAVRDTWCKSGDARYGITFREACVQAAALMFWPREELLDAVKTGLFTASAPAMRDFGGGWVLPAVSEVCPNLKAWLAVGEVLLQQQESADKQTATEAYRFKVASLRVACFQGDSRSASDVRELLGDDVDLVLAWAYFVEHEDRDGWASQTRKMKVSARSKKGGFPCHLLAKHNNGNGHQPAAGFVLDVSGVASNPYTVLEGLILGFTGAAAGGAQ